MDEGIEKFLKYVREVLDGMTDEEVSAMLDKHEQRIDKNDIDDGRLPTNKALKEFNLIIVDDDENLDSSFF
jgi:hypothetical protein